VAETEDLLKGKSSKVLFILDNILKLIKSVQFDSEKLQTCQSQLQEQGIMDIMFRCLEIIYYKVTPPIMF